MADCPCIFEEVEACSYACTCRTPLMSGGCSRCATYGDYKQRAAMAQQLASILPKRNMKNVINLVIGDWSTDGHSMTETFTIKCNLTAKALMKAYEKGTRKVGFSWTEDVAKDYEDNSFPDELREKLEKHGFDFEEFRSKWSDDDEDTLAPDNFYRIWLWIAKLGAPSLKYEEVPNNAARINIGGYGLFSG